MAALPDDSWSMKLRDVQGQAKDLHEDQARHGEDQHSAVAPACDLSLVEPVRLQPGPAEDERVQHQQNAERYPVENHFAHEQGTCHSQAAAKQGPAEKPSL